MNFAKDNIYCVVDPPDSDYFATNAGSKAREDIDTILLDGGCSPIVPKVAKSLYGNSSLLGKLLGHKRVADVILNALDSVSKGACVIWQFPLYAHSPFFSHVLKLCRHRGIYSVLLVHDLEGFRWAQKSDTPLRRRIRLVFEEESAIKTADLLIVHNQVMRERLVSGYGVPAGIIIDLGVFDYLSGADFPEVPTAGKSAPVVVAGNLRRHKAGYLYDLPKDVDFRLYGAGYEGGSTDKVEYMGVFPPDELPSALEGAFGLVWDGDSASTCAGVYGEYLRINNPHKTSLYLASGLPVIIWDKAALAPFVLKNGLGLAVSSLHDIRATVDSLSDGEYEAMRARARAMGERLRRGEFTRTAVEECLRRLGAADGGDVRA